MMNDIGKYRIRIAKQWVLNDLYEFPHAFDQTYAFAYCFDSSLSPRDAERINFALENYPWRGGYSIANIYKVLEHQVPPIYRPRIKSIQYASPGWIELLLNLEPAVKVAASVATIMCSMAAATKAYATIQKTLHSIKLQREKSELEHLQLSRAQATALRGLCQELAQLMGFKKFEELVERTGNLEVAGKLLSAQFRRLKTIARYSEKGKVLLPNKSEISQQQLPPDGNAGEAER
jgi:hypothetical protein